MTMTGDRFRILLVIAPSRHEAAKTIEAYGLDLAEMAHMRVVTNAYLLHRWSAGAPYITGFRETWGRTPQTRALEAVLTRRTLRHELRPANERDLAALRLAYQEAAE